MITINKDTVQASAAAAATTYAVTGKNGAVYTVRTKVEGQDGSEIFGRYENYAQAAAAISENGFVHVKSWSQIDAKAAPKTKGSKRQTVTKLGYDQPAIHSDAPKCPTHKAVFKATDPEGDTVYRTSAREYTHALALFRKAEPAWADTQWVDGPTPPEGFEFLHSAISNGRKDYSRICVGRRIADKPDRWGIVSFHGDAVNAEKAAGQYHAQGHRVVPVEIVEDRRIPRDA